MRRRPHKIRMNAAPQLSTIWQHNSVPTRKSVFSSHRHGLQLYSTWNCVYNGRKYEWMGGFQLQAVTMSSQRRYTPREVACDALQRHQIALCSGERLVRLVAEEVVHDGAQNLTADTHSYTERGPSLLLWPAAASVTVRQ